MSLEELTTELGSAYDKQKEFELKLKGKTGKNPEPGLKQRFFDEATQAQTSTLAQKTVRIVAKDESTASSIVAKRYPRWNVTKIESTEDSFDILIEENPEFKPFVFVNKKDGRVWTKQIVDGSPWIDDDELRSDNPELWNEVSDIPNRVTIKNVMYECNVELDELDERLDELWEAYDGPREMKSLEDLDAEQIDKVQRYVYPGKPVVKLAAPRKAKPEELSDE